MKLNAKPSLVLACALSLPAGMAVAQAPAPAAAASTPAARYAAESQALSARYQSDLRLCNTEADAAGRMQCKRDAKVQYDQGLADAAARRNAALAAAKAPAATTTTTTTATTRAATVCADCGTVTAVSREERQGQASPVGAIAGGLVGGMLGNQIGEGSGKDIATIAGAAGGVYAGREVEKRINARTVWVVKVRFGDGSAGSYEFAQDPGFRTGDAVKKAGNSVSRS